MSETPARTPEPHDERLLHRLEAFSDIVIGFSLAQAGLNLTIPQHGVVQLFVQPYGLIAFGCTFLFVCAIWYQHHRIFAYYFKPRTLTVVINFVMLGFTILLVYALQVFVRFLPTDQVDAATVFYFAALAIVYILLAALFAIGVRDRRSELDATLRTRGIRSAVRLAAFAVGTILGLFVAKALAVPLFLAPWFCVPFIIAARIVWRVSDARTAKAKPS